MFPVFVLTMVLCLIIFFDYYFLAWQMLPVYTVAKAGLVVLTRCLHQEMKEWGGKVK